MVRVVTLTNGTADAHHLPPSVERRVLTHGHMHTGVAGQTWRLAQRIHARLQPLVCLFLLRREFMSGRPDAVMSFVTPTNVLCLLATMGLGTRTIVSERNDPRRQSFGPVWNALRYLLYRRAAYVTANTEYALRYFVEFVKSQQLAMLQNPVEITADVGTERALGRKIIGVGRLHRQKGFDVLIRAFASSHCRSAGWDLVIAGEGPERAALESLTLELGLQETVQLPGFIHSPFDRYCDAAIFVLPSRYEGQPNALLEAMAHGVAPIVTDVQDGSLAIVDETCAIVVPVEDAPALAAALDRLVARPELRRRFAAEGRSRADTFTLARVKPAWDRVVGIA